MGEVDRLGGGVVDPHTGTRMDKLPWKALLRAAATMEHGMKYERAVADNWRQVPAWRHLDHALRHIALWQSGDRTEDHVGHALNRMLMWGELV